MKPFSRSFASLRRTAFPDSAISKSGPTFIKTFVAALLILAVLQIGFPAPTPAAAAVAPSPAGSPAAQPTPAAQQVCDNSRTVQVTGSAVVNVTPDRILVQLGVQSNGVTTHEVERLNTATIEAVLRAVRAQGVEAKDIATDWYVIEPVYENYDSLFIKGYRINNTVAVTVRDASKVSRVIAAALQAGANQVVNVDFYTSELRKYRDQARELAMQAAQEKARDLARVAGARAGCVLSINENSWSYYNGWSGRGQNQNQWTQNVAQNVAPSGALGSGAGEEPISLGMISVKAEISASFGLE